jgi:hypothetical protein
VPILIQLHYGRRVPESAADGWVTVGTGDHLRAAAREATRYRSLEHPDGGRAGGLRLESEEHLRDVGGANAVAEAYESLRRMGARLLEAPAPG